MKLTSKDIIEINGKVLDSWNEGVFTEPSYIPIAVKEPVVYMRWVSSGASGGDCWGDEAEYFTGDKPKFNVLELTLEKIKPGLTYLEFKKVEGAIESNFESNYEYYGNYDDYSIEWITLSKIYEILGIE